MRGWDFNISDVLIGPFDMVSVIRDVRYGNGDRHLLDIYQPDKCNGKKMYILFVHGGGWQRGDKNAYKYFVSFQDVNWVMYLLQKFRFKCYENVGRALAEKGFTCVIPNYSLSSLHFPFAFVEILSSFLASFAVFCVPMVLFSNWNVLWLGTIFCVVVFLYGDSIRWKCVWYGLMVVYFGWHVELHLVKGPLCLAGVGSVVHSIGLCIRQYGKERILHPRHVLDIALAVDFVKRCGGLYGVQYGEDVVLMGHSAGAHLSALLALRKDDFGVEVCIHGVIAISGVYDLKRLVETNGFAKYLYVGASFLDKDLKSASPVLYVEKEKTPPFLMMNAEKDAGLYEQAELFRRVLMQKGCVDVQKQVLVVFGKNHLSIMTSINNVTNDVIQASVAFLNRLPHGDD